MSDYDKSLMDSYILYLDANNLYGYAMCEYLPQSNFKWNTQDWNTDKILNLNDEGEKGYLFNVNLHYNKELHDLHNGYALGPENQSIKNDMLNTWQQYGYKGSSVKKLITSFEDKENYGINYRLLKLYFQLGIKITKINRVLQYSQDNYMKPYIMLNTEQRTKATTEFEKDCYKLMNNSVYGKLLKMYVID